MTIRQNESIVTPRVMVRFPEIRCGMSLRGTGPHASPFGQNISYRVGDHEANVRETRERFFDAMGMAEHDLATIRQCHSDTVVSVSTAGDHGEADALVTDTPGLSLGVTVADCVPLLLYAPRVGAMGAIHAGWRGTRSGIAVKAVDRMEEEFDLLPAEIFVWIGPCASVCCYRVGIEVAELFPEESRMRKDGSWYLDLKGENFRQLVSAGVPEEQIEIHPACTICDGTIYHSYRRDGSKSGRMMAVIGRKKG